MTSPGGPQKEDKDDQPKPNEEQKEAPNPGDPPKQEDDKKGEE